MSSISLTPQLPQIPRDQTKILYWCGQIQQAIQQLYMNLAMRLEAITEPSELKSADGSVWQLRVTNDGLLRTVKIGDNLLDGSVWQLRVTNDGLLQTVKIGEGLFKKTELKSADGGIWQLRVTNDGLLQTVKI